MQCRKDGCFGHIILDNTTPHNAFDDTVIQDLSQHLMLLEEDNDIRVVLLSAEGPSFSAGADIHWMKKMAHFSMTENQADAMQLARLMHTLNTLKKPTIALVQGNAYGGALGLIACCDIALASPNAFFCFSEVKLGLIPAVISPYVISAIGERMARRYFLTAERFSAQTALDIQLIHSISENLMHDGLMLAEKIAQNSPYALTHIKKLMQDMHPIPDDIIHKTANAIAQARVSVEGQEGLHAFLEKRSPQWINEHVHPVNKP